MEPEESGIETRQSQIKKALMDLKEEENLLKVKTLWHLVVSDF